MVEEEKQRDKAVPDFDVDIKKVSTPLREEIIPNTTNVFGDNFALSVEHNAKQASIIKEEMRLDNIESASITDKYFGLSAIFDGSDVGGVIDYFKYDRGILRGKDEEFVKTFNKDKEDLTLKLYGLKEESRPYIQEAKNDEHLTDLATKEKLKTEAMKKVMNTYTDNEALVANLAVALATDPTVLLTGGAVYLVRGATVLAKNEKVTSALSNLDKGGQLERGLEATTEYQSFANLTLVSLQKTSQTEGALMVAEAMKQGLAKAVTGSIITYGGVVGATQEDVSLIEGLIAYGLLSPIDYKIINSINVLGRSPRTTGLGKNTIDDMYRSDLLVENKLPQSGRKVDETTSEILLLERNLKFDAKMTKIQKDILKADITSRLKMSKSIGFKKLTTIHKNIKVKIKELELKGIKDSKIFDAASRLRIVGKEIEDIQALARDIEMDIADVSKALEIISKTDKGKNLIAKDILNIYGALRKAGYLSHSNYSKLEYSYNKGKGKGFKPPKIEISPKRVGDKTIAEIKINGKIVKTLGASALAASGLSAYDGGDLAQDASSIVGLGLLLGLLGVGVAFKLNTIGMRQSIRGGIKRATQGKAYDDTRNIRSSIGNFFNNSRTSVTETTKPILDNTEGAINKFARIFYFDPLDQTAKTIETTKRTFAHSKSQGLERELREIFIAWRGEKDISNIKNIASMFTDLSFRGKFNKEVWEHMTMGKHANDKNIIAGAKKVSEYNAQVLKDMQDAGVKNADKMIHVIDGLYYVPRINNGLEFANKITGISASSKEKLILRFSQMLTRTPEVRKLAVSEAYIDNMIRMDLTSSKTFSKDNREALIKELDKKGLSEIEIDEIVSAISGTYGRTEARLHMDYSKFGKLSIEINGQPVTLTIDDIFMSDISSVSNTLFNQAGGHVAFAINGFNSVDEVIALVRDANMLESHKKIMMNDIYATVGVPSIDYSQTANIVAKNLANMSIAKMMQYSTISLMSEGFIYVANTLRQSGVIDGMKNLTHSVRGFGDDSFIASDVPFGKDGLGLGQSRYSGTYGQFRTFDEFSNQDSAINKFSKFTEMWRDFTLHTLPFSRTSDFISKANLQDVMDRLYKHLDGSLPLSEHELLAFPITPKMEKYLRENLHLNDKGHVKFFDYTKGDFSTKDEFKNLIDNMMMKRMNQTTMGTSGAYTRQSALGVALSAMLKYPMSAYSNLGGFLGRGVLQGDSFAMIQIALWFQAGMVQSMLRSEIQGRDYDEDDIIVAGITNIPHYGLIGTITGLGDSPSSNMAESLTNVLDIYNYAKSN